MYRIDSFDVSKHSICGTSMYISHLASIRPGDPGTGACLHPHLRGVLHLAHGDMIYDIYIYRISKISIHRLSDIDFFDVSVSKHRIPEVSIYIGGMLRYVAYRNWPSTLWTDHDRDLPNCEIMYSTTWYLIVDLNLPFTIRCAGSVIVDIISTTDPTQETCAILRVQVVRVLRLPPGNMSQIIQIIQTTQIVQVIFPETSRSPS